ncbi:MAG: protein translocase subunit SecD [Solirubrobacteraceae bacterium]
MAAAPRNPVARPALLRLGVLALIIVAAYATMALTGNMSPKLGLDLQGGTTVTLTPVVLQGGSPPSGSVDKAVDIIRQRVNALGVSSAEVKRVGDKIEVAVPGKGRAEVLSLVGTTAELQFREVVTRADATPSPAPTPTPTPSPSGSPKPSASSTPSATSGATTTAPATSSAPSPSTSPKALAPLALGGATGTTAKLAAFHRPLAATTSAATPAATASAAPTASAKTTPTPSGTAAPTAGAAAPGQPPASVIKQFQELDCATYHPDGNGPPDQYVVACDKEQPVKYLLAPARVIGTDVKSASATVRQGPNGTVTGDWIVQVQFTGSGQGKFTKLTQDTVGKQVAVELDGVVQSAPTIQIVISGDAEISGSFTQGTAEDLANVLKFGALPLTFKPDKAQTISPTLGKASLHAGLIAGAIGIGLVIVYSFIYYRALGVVTIASLFVSGALVYASVCLLGAAIGFTLTLAGIAGLIVAIGITADSFVVFYERLKDEVREGRSVRTSVERGWVSARRTILSADTVSFLAAVILYIVSIGDVRGFAFTLGLSTLLDVVVVFIFTKPLVTLLVQRPFFSTGRFSGLSAKAMGLKSIPTAERPAVRRPTRPKRPRPAGGEI